MTSSEGLAILWDLYPRDSSSALEWRQDVDQGLAMLKDFSWHGEVCVYLLSPTDGISDVLEQLTSSTSNTAILPRVVTSKDKIGAFYRAKQDFDAREISDVRVVCHRSRCPFWRLLCRDLFTPVHTWSVESPASKEEVGSHDEESVRDSIRHFLRTLPSLLGQPEVERSKVIPAEKFVHGYSTRRGGVSSPRSLTSMNLLYTDKKRDPRLVTEENLRRLAQVGGFDYKNFHIIRTEHGHRVWRVGREQQPDKYDALVTDLRDVTIAAAGADCLVLLFADPVAMVIGAAHAGWRGTVERVATHVVRTMVKEYGSRPQNIHVALGPALRMGCFRLGEEEAQLFSDVHPACVSRHVGPVSHHIGEGTFSRASSKTVVRSSLDGVVDQDFLPVSLLEEPTTPRASGDLGPTFAGGSDPSEDLRYDSDVTSRTDKSEGTRGLESQRSTERKLKAVWVDLQLTNRLILEDDGVQTDLIDSATSHCTKCNPHLYFSYERDGVPFGNQIGFICMPSQPAT